MEKVNAPSEDFRASLMTTLGSDEMISVASDAAEVALDANLVEGLAKDVPVVSIIVSIAKVGLTVRDTLFIRKLLRFLRTLKDVPIEARKGMAEKLEQDPAYGRNAGEHLMEILEKIDAHRKPEMTARAFAAYVMGNVDAITLHRLNNAIDKLPFYEIDSLRRIDESIKAQGKFYEPDATCQALENAGLMNAASAFGGLAYQPNDLFGKFLELELDRIGKTT